MIRLTPFLKNVVKVFSGDLIVKIIGFLSIAVIARLYSPEDFGALELAISIQLIAVTFASLKYEQAIPLPESDKEAFNLFSFSFILLIVFCLLSLIGTFIIFCYKEHFEVLAKLGNLLYFIPPLIFLRGSREIITYWFIRKKRFGRSAIAEIGNKIGEVAGKIGFFWIGVYGLFLGNIVGLLTALMVLFVFTLQMDKQLFVAIKKRTMGQMHRKYKKFSMFLLPSFLFWMIAERLPAIILVPMFGLTAVGFYGISFKMINEPLNILGKSIAYVLYQESSDRFNMNQDIDLLFIKVVEKLFVALFLPICFLLTSSDILFKVVLGEQWINAGRYTQILAPMMFFRFLVMPIPVILKVREKTHFEMFFNFLLLVVCTCSLVSGFFVKNIEITLGIYSFSLSILYMFWFILIIIFLNISYKNIFKKIYIELFLTIPCIVFFVVVKLLLGNYDYLYLFVCGIVFSIYYLCIFYIYKKRGDF